MRSILALDPGVTTGAAAWYVNWEPHSFELHEFRQEQIWSYLDGVNVAFGSFVIVCESFLYRADQSHAELEGVEVIGIVKEWCRQNDVPLTFQRPDQAKFFYTKDRLQKAGLWTKGKPHAMDALRHLLYSRKDFLVDAKAHDK